MTSSPRCNWLAMIPLLVFPACVAAEVTFTRDIKPILVARCYRCHSSLAQEGNLRLDSAAAILKGGDEGTIVVPGKSAESRLLLAVLRTSDLQMPPEGDPLTPEQIATLRTWIDAGAKLPTPEQEAKIDHWSFTPPQRPSSLFLSSSANSAPLWSHHPIDQLISLKHHELGLSPTADAPKNLLLRRLYLDLIGLPPTPAQLRAFLADDSPQAYEKVVDELLASSQYGQRWGRHWMDVWRYSDWDGYGNEVRESKPHIWRWRDWIVESLNADVPYDQMIVEMLAADELAPNDPQRVRATGFLVRNWYKFNRNTWLDNTIEHTGKAFLGVTFNCARCHDHMYDPLSQQEYYQLRAFFEPLEIRTDRVPGQTDVNLDGVVRVYDAKAETPTFLFMRGNEKDPVKDKPLAAQTPRVFRDVALALQQVSLPGEVSYPGMQRFIREEASSAAESEVTKARAELEKATQEFNGLMELSTQFVDAVVLAEPSPPKVPVALTDADLKRELAEKSLLAAEANLQFIRARVTADDANFANPPAANAKELSLVAGAAERASAVAAAAKNLAQQELTLVQRRQSGKKDAEAAKLQTAAETAFTAALKTLETAKTAALQPHESYTRLTAQYPATSTGRRLALAKWIAAKNNPLTARVAVNHIWLRHFGTPLVPSVFDFGMNGKPPTNQPVLDWLAVELMDSGWKMKHLHKLIVTSRTYRLHSAGGEVAAANQAIDPDNLYYWRANPRRMEAEVVRDSTLSLGGTLDLKHGGPDLDPAQGFVLPRRSLYFRNSKEKKMTFLAVFDSPNVVECYRRSESIAPQQALAMSNSPLSLAQARLLTKKLSGQFPTQDVNQQTPFIRAAFECVLCRQPTNDELQTCEQFLAEQAAQLTDTKSLTSFGAGAVIGIDPATDPRERARENLVHVLLNHNDFVTIR
ncbi:PSD1 and planctomycete cytochrome C domain-containing protein [Anatilimnocola sp. NA78]|uniref:PSD1 and planctomycete cytochrome C domain-containing protein n=1 Tax=Anatilimnocola sp. NA78 TaxID=3415683 RepID=UPI003CE58DE1